MSMYHRSIPKKRKLENAESELEVRQKKLDRLLADHKRREGEIKEIQDEQVAAHETLKKVRELESWQPSGRFTEETIVEASRRRILESGADKKKLEKTISKIASEVRPSVSKIASSEFLINAITKKGMLPTGSNGFVACKYWNMNTSCFKGKSNHRESFKSPLILSHYCMLCASIFDLIIPTHGAYNCDLLFSLDNHVYLENLKRLPKNLNAKANIDNNAYRSPAATSTTTSVMPNPAAIKNYTIPKLKHAMPAETTTTAAIFSPEVVNPMDTTTTHEESDPASGLITPPPPAAATEFETAATEFNTEAEYDPEAPEYDPAALGYFAYRPSPLENP